MKKVILIFLFLFALASSVSAAECVKSSNSYSGSQSKSDLSDEVDKLNLQLEGIFMPDNEEEPSRSEKEGVSNKSALEMLKKRQDRMKALANKDPSAFMNKLLDEELVRELPQGSRKYVEKRVDIKGSFQTTHYHCMKKNGEKNSGFLHYLHRNGNKLEVKPIFELGSNNINAAKVEGYKIDGETLVGFVEPINGTRDLKDIGPSSAKGLDHSVRTIESGTELEVSWNSNDMEVCEARKGKGTPWQEFDQIETKGKRSIELGRQNTELSIHCEGEEGSFEESIKVFVEGSSQSSPGTKPSSRTVSGNDIPFSKFLGRVVQQIKAWLTITGEQTGGPPLRSPKNQLKPSSGMLDMKLRKQNGNSYFPCSLNQKLINGTCADVHSLGVLMVNFQDSDKNPFNKSEIDDRIFDGPLQDLAHEQSYNKIHFEGDVYGWHTIPRPINSTESSHVEDCQTDWSDPELSKYISNQSIKEDQYDKKMVIVNGKDCVFGGIETSNEVVVHGDSTDLNYNDHWQHFNNWSWFTSTAFHELGHSFGLPHAEGKDCGNRSLPLPLDPGYCESFEYGNTFDNLGDGYYGEHFNPLFKKKLGWLEKDQMIEINKSGNYILTPLEHSQENHSSKYKGKGAKVVFGPSTSSSLGTYLLSYRRAEGYDKTMQETGSNKGLFISRFGYDPLLIDTSPSIGPDYPSKTEDFWDNNDSKDAFLEVGEKFNDSIGNEIEFDSVTSSGNAVVDIKFNKNCKRRKPRFDGLGVNPSTFELDKVVSKIHKVTLSAYNFDSPRCKDSDLKFDIKSNKLKWYQLNKGPHVLKNVSGFSKEFYNSPRVVINKSVCSGKHNVTIGLKNLDSGMETTKNLSIEVERGTPCPKNTHKTPGGSNRQAPPALA